MVYSKWRPYLDPSIDLHPVELAGRGKRFQEVKYNSLDEAVEDIYGKIKPFLSRPFAFYGHSMGSLLVHEVSCKIRQESGLSPVHLFVSGRKAPHIPAELKKIHLLPDDEFKEEIQKLGGTPDELLENVELFDFFKPVLKADYKMIEEYEYPFRDYRLDCDITVLNGRDDTITEEELTAWEQLTSRSCQVKNFDGGHFFINSQFESIVNLINQETKNRLRIS